MIFITAVKTFFMKGTLYKQSEQLLNKTHQAVHTQPKVMIMNNVKSSHEECSPDPGNDTELSNLVDKVETHSPRIMEIRHRVEYILARLSGPQPAAEQPEETKPGGLIHRLDYANEGAVESFHTLEESVARLEALV